MEGFTWVDGVVLAVIVISALLAYSRGLVRETLSILGWIAAAVVAFVLGPSLEPLMREVPVLRDVIGTNCELGVLAGFAVVFAVALVVVSLFTPLLSSAVQHSALGPVDQGLGLLFGVARGVLLVAIALAIYNRALGAGPDGEGGVAAVEASRSIAVFAGVESQLAALLPENVDWITERWDQLNANCQ